MTTRSSSRRRRRLRTTSAALLVVLALTSSAAAATGASAGVGSQRAEKPRVKACYRLDFDQATQPTSNVPPRPCSKRHTAQTYFVGRLNTVVDGHMLAVDSKLAQRQVERTCPGRLEGYLGGSDQARALSRIKAVWFSPTIEQSDQGASWFRCDAVAVAASSRLARLPPPRQLRGILDRSSALERVGLCGTAAPGTRGFQRVICSRRHAWRAISTIGIGGSGYPGVAAVRDAGAGTCRDQVRQQTGSSEKFSYGWEWPTAQQWRAGQHLGYCWAPD